ncbi:MAG: hypothetical protein JXD22_11715 [Sedimentisphaerales bacterium]|nr:hypothetical protein [Sedimentisphaerales bacterium]
MLRIGCTNTFFDKPKVINAVGRATRKVLSKFGAYVRRTAKTSIRKRKKVSAPGQPPASHTGRLKKLIFFAYDPIKASVVIGPALGNMISFNGSGKPVRGTVPETLEYGGRIGTLVGKRVDAVWCKWSRVDLRNKRRYKKTKMIFSDIKARPYMNPAFEKEKPKLPLMWQDSVRS